MVYVKEARDLAPGDQFIHILQGPHGSDREAVTVGTIGVTADRIEVTSGSRTFAFAPTEHVRLGSDPHR